MTNYNGLDGDPGAVANARLAAPDWAEPPYVHQWQRYISDELRAIWSTFTPDQRLVIARSAQEVADEELWD